MAPLVKQSFMSFKIDSGLFKFNFTDHHAILGVPLDADAKEIRKRYLKIARRLHPDTCAAASDTDKQRASEILSKLVNPAYEKFSHASSRAEYALLLKEISKRLLQEAATIELRNELSRQLKETHDVEQVYKTSLGKLAEKHYESLDQVTQLIGQTSELNLVYLMRRGGKQGASIGRDQAPPIAQPESIVEQYFRRAQALVAKNNFAQARVELQDALKLEPTNSRCHSLMGSIYLKQNQLTMAKVHINKALQLNPREPMALEAKKFLNELMQKAGNQQSDPQKPNENKPPDKSGGGSLFGSLFSGKKK